MRHKKRKNWIMILLLAFLCIGGVELMVCRVMDPALYARITAPVKEGIMAIGDQLMHTKDALLERVQALDPEEIPETQLATTPQLWDANTAQADRQLTALEIRDGVEVLTGGNCDLRYYNQSDPAWCDMAYGSDAIGGYGCGPTAMAMAISSLTETDINPGNMATWAKDQGYWAKGHGSYLSIVEGTAVAYGLRARPMLDRSVENLHQELAGGTVLVALMTRGHFTNGGHFILLRGVTMDGKVLVADPSSRERSLTLWDPQLILDELSASRSHGAPLWSLSKALEK